MPTIVVTGRGRSATAACEVASRCWGRASRDPRRPDRWADELLGQPRGAEACEVRDPGWSSRIQAGGAERVISAVGLDEGLDRGVTVGERGRTPLRFPAVEAVQVEPDV